MQVQSIQSNINFKEKYMPRNLCENIIRLKQLMQSDTVILKDKTITQTIYVRGLAIQGGEAVFKDGRFLAKRNKANVLVPYGKDTAMLEFGNVRLISNDDGEIIEYKKPFFLKWNSVFEKAGDYIKFAIDNYKDNILVNKQCNKKEQLTEEGKKQARELFDIFNRLNPFSKE